MYSRLIRKFSGLVLAAALMLTGCAMGSASGKMTRQGISELDQGDYMSAAGSFSEAVTAGEELMLAYRGLGIAYMGLGEYEKAEGAFARAIENADLKSPENIEDIRLYLATVQYRLEKYEEAIITCDEILNAEKGKLMDKCGDAYYLRGASYLHEDQTDLAQADFVKAVSLNPENYDLYLNIYESYQQMNLSGLGGSYLQDALNIQGDSVENFYNRGRIYYYLENYDAAQSELIGPVEQKYQPAMILIAKVYLAQQDYEHAIAIYEELQKESGADCAVLNGFAVCEIARGNLNQALEYVQQGLALDDKEDKQELYFNEIVIYEKMEDYATAKDKAREYVSHYPTDEAGQKEYTFLSTRK